MNFPMRSLTLRLALISAIWVGGGLSLAGWLASAVLTRQVEAAFDSRLAAQLDALVAALSAGVDGRPRVASRSLSDPEFQRPLSGLYWQREAFPEALKIWRELIAREPGNIGYVEALYKLYLKLGDGKKAIALYEEAAQANPRLAEQIGRAHV